MNSNDNIEYLGCNVSPEGVLLEKKTYYFWNTQLSSLIPSQLLGVLSPFDYAIRKDGELSISCFIKSDKTKNIEWIFEFVKSQTLLHDCTFVKDQFLAIYNPRKEIHYPPIVSFKYKSGTLNKLSLYVAPLHKKSEMEDYLKRTMGIFTMKHSKETRILINHLVTTRICDMYMAAWDIDEKGCNIYKVYLKIKNSLAMSEIINKKIREIIPFQQVEGFRLSDIGFVFSHDRLSHYNIYHKPLK